jgi:hypothetical protein
MRADMASDANMEENPFSDRGQNSAIIAEPTREIKTQALRQPPLQPHRPAGMQLTGRRPAAQAQSYSQAKAGPYSPPQGAFLLNTHQGVETVPHRI